MDTIDKNFDGEYIIKTLTNPLIQNLNADIDSSQAAMGFFAHFREVYEQRASRESLGLVARLPMHAAQHHYPIA